MRIYYVKSGENFEQIGKTTKREPEDIARLNGRGIGDTLAQGEAILLPERREYRLPLQGRDGALCINGILDAGTDSAILKHALPYLKTATEVGGTYLARGGLILPKQRHKQLFEEGGVTSLLMPEIGREMLSPLGKEAETLQAGGYGGLVLDIGEYSTEELTSALPQLGKIYKLNNLILYAAIQEAQLKKRPKLWMLLGDMLDGILLFADDIPTSWERRLAHLGEDFPLSFRRRLYTELPYALLRREVSGDRYLPLSQMGREIQKDHAKRGQGPLEWAGDAHTYYGEDVASTEYGMRRLARIGMGGASLHIGYTPRWVYALLDQHFICQGGCGTDGRRSPL